MQVLRDFLKILYAKGVHGWALFVFNHHLISIFAEKDERGLDEVVQVGGSR